MTKTPNYVDKHVGARVRMARMMLNMSQEKLGDALDLTFQQIQKYEKGSNRIGASRLQQISIILVQPIAWFFDGLPESAVSVAFVEAGGDKVTAFGGTTDGARIVAAFPKITDPKMRQAIVATIEAAAAA